MTSASRTSRCNYMDGSLPFPTFPRFCGQTFYEGDDKELGLACVKAYNDWMVEEWCAPIRRRQHPALPHPAVGRRAGRRRDRSATPSAASGPSAFSEIPTRLGLPSIHTDYWDPLLQVCNDNGVTLCMHIGSSSTNPAGVARHATPAWAAPSASTTRWRRWPTGCSRASCCSSPS